MITWSDVNVITWSADSQPNTSVVFRATVTSQHGDVKPEPEVNCDMADVSDKTAAERDKCRTLRRQPLHDVNDVNVMFNSF